MTGFLPELPGCVERVGGVSGLPALRVSGPRSSGVVQLQGAQVTSFVPHGGREMLWLSPDARAGATAIRGGVPVCFPWFGSGLSGDRSPSHGPARLARWRVRSAEEREDAVVVTLVLTPDAVAALGHGESWPDGLFATLEVSFGDELGLRFTARNEGEADVTLELALHAYLAVDDVRGVCIDGLDGSHVLDQVTGATGVVDGVMTFAGEVDSVVTAPGRSIVVSAEEAPRYRVERENLPDAVVWNPAAHKAAALSDVPDDAWPQFVCVEAAAVEHDAVTVAAGEQAVFRASYVLASVPGRTPPVV